MKLHTIAIFFAALLTGSFLPACAQGNMISGIVGELHLPDSFLLGDRPIHLTHKTKFAAIIESDPNNPSPDDTPVASLANLLPGAYVSVDVSYTDGVITAGTIEFLDLWLKPVEVHGPIDKVLKIDGETVYRADGYLLRIPSGIKTVLDPSIDSLDKVVAGDWVEFEGRFGTGGIVVASKVHFEPPQYENLHQIKFIDTSIKVSVDGGGPAPSAPAADDYCAKIEQGVTPSAHEVKIGLIHYQISLDQALNLRIAKIGCRLIPQYQRTLAPDSASHFNFIFLVVDSKHLHHTITSQQGVIFFPVQVLKKLKTDEQIAALLADAIAANLTRQFERIIYASRYAKGAIAASFIPYAGLVSAAAGDVAVEKFMRGMMQERARMALYLMQDAGYDPHAAPVAWDLLSSKPINPNQFRPGGDDDETIMRKYQQRFLTIEFNPAGIAAHPQAKNQ
jgi:hypothetical protein